MLNKWRYTEVSIVVIAVDDVGLLICDHFVKVIKLFSSSVTERQNKLECLPPSKPFQPGLILEGKARNQPRGKHLKGTPLR